MTRSKRMLIDRELVESALELLEDTWVGAPCDEGCDCILHPLRSALGISERKRGAKGTGA